MEVSRPCVRITGRTEALENVRLPFLHQVYPQGVIERTSAARLHGTQGINRLNKYRVPFINRVFLRDEVLVCNENQ